MSIFHVLLREVQRRLLADRADELRAQDAFKAATRPLATLVLSGAFACAVEDDGTEVISDGRVTIRVPRSCVTWTGGTTTRTASSFTSSDVLRSRDGMILLVQSLLDGSPRPDPADLPDDADDSLYAMMEALT